MVWYRSIGLVVVLMVALLVSACGGGEPIALTDIPTFPNATPIDAGQNQTADLFLDTVQSSLPESMTAESSLYTLPAGTAWADVQSHYSNAVSEGDWEAASELNQESEFINVAGWQRGGLAGEQILMVAQGNDPLSGETFLITAIFSE